MTSATILTTKEAIEAVRKANPGRRLTEPMLRGAIRCERIEPPITKGRSYLWTPDDVVRIARAFRLRAPAIEAPQ